MTKSEKKNVAGTSENYGRERENATRGKENANLANSTPRTLRAHRATVTPITNSYICDLVYIYYLYMYIHTGWTI